MLNLLPVPVRCSFAERRAKCKPNDLSILQLPPSLELPQQSKCKKF